MSEVQRRLTTILATDCVSFSKYMEEQEENTLRSLKQSRKLIDKRIKEGSGRIFHTAGDSVIAEFTSPVACVNAAISFQRDISKLNKNSNVIPKLTWRVGVHIDDVIIEKDNVYGTGVNLAARLESHCNPE